MALKFKMKSKLKVKPKPKPKKNTDEMVVGSTHREVFHRPDCTYAAYILPSPRLREFENAREAREAGWIPCRICLGWSV
jgi:hypothetical protein